MIESLLYAAKFDKTSVAAVAADTAITDGDILDLANFDSVCGIAILGEVTTTSVPTLKAYVGNVATLTDGAYATTTATHTALLNDADNTLLVLDVVKCGKRYVRFDMTRATANTVVDSIIAIRYNARVIPISQDSTEVSGSGVSVNAG
jgi:hypothetical protein